MPRRSVDCVDLTLDNLHDLPGPCRACVFWELDPASIGAIDPEMEKEAWLSDTLLEWGRCGHLAYAGGQPAGYVLYAPAAYVPRSAAFPTAPVSPDAVLLISGFAYLLAIPAFFAVLLPLTARVQLKAA